MSSTTDGYGTITWWGFSPANDLHEVITSYSKAQNNTEEINILLVGSADARHIIKTISKFKNKQQKLHFYIEENSLELFARQLLFLRLAFESNDIMGAQEKAELYLEILGNVLLRNDSNDYISKKSTEFIDWITDLDKMHKSFPICDCSNLKFKERDQLEAIFKFWQNPNQEVFNVMNLWENRLRQFLGVRYDYRDNAYDWEYSMKLKDKASIVNWNDYKNWREYGVAFHIRDKSAYLISNKTLASGRIFMKEGERIPRRGYWGDIINSPFVTFGIESHEKTLFEQKNNVHVKSATDVAMFNVDTIMKDLADKENKTKISDNIQITFLPIGSTTNLHKKSKFTLKFNLVYFSNSMVHLLKEDLKSVFHPQGLLMVESTKFMLDLKPELHDEYTKKICTMAHNVNCQEVTSFNAEKDNYGLYSYQENCG